MSLRPASHPEQEPLPQPAACARCSRLERELAAARASLAEARRAERRASRKLEVLLEYVPVRLGEIPIPPLRHRLADDLNRAVRSVPGVHRALKGVVLGARRALLRLRPE